MICRAFDIAILVEHIEEMFAFKECCQYRFDLVIITAEYICQRRDHICFGRSIDLVVNKEAIEFATDEFRHFLCCEYHIQQVGQFQLTCSSTSSAQYDGIIKKG